MPCCDNYSGVLPQPLGLIVLGSNGQCITQSETSLELAMVAYLGSREEVVCKFGTRMYPHSVSRKNTTWPVLTYYRSSTEPVNSLAGSGGIEIASMGLDVWSPDYTTTLRAAEVLRQAMYGFQGYWLGVGIYSCLFDGGSDQVEKPGDGSGQWWYSRSLDYRITHSVTSPTF